MPFLISKEGLDSADRIQLGISYALQLAMYVFFLMAVYRHQWLNAVAILAILVLTFVPGLLRRNYRIFVPIEFDFIAIIFIFAALFLGEMQGYYTQFWWWDILLHTTSGFLLGIVGFLLVYILNEEKSVQVKLKAGFVALFSFTFALALGALWEIFEFSMDYFFGLNMQKSGLYDTMGDLMVDTIGAAVIAVVGYFYIRRKKVLLLERIITRFVERNPSLFKR